MENIGVKRGRRILKDIFFNDRRGGGARSDASRTAGENQNERQYPMRIERLVKTRGRAQRLDHFFAKRKLHFKKCKQLGALLRGQMGGGVQDAGRTAGDTERTKDEGALSWVPANAWRKNMRRAGSYGGWRGSYSALITALNEEKKGRAGGGAKL